MLTLPPSPRERSERSERGASLVEFALILPLFMMLVLGMFSGGVAYNRRLSLTQSVREGARYGAPLDMDRAGVANGAGWADAVREVVQARADLGLTDADVCVALVSGSNGSTVVTASGNAYTTGATSNWPANCYSDNDTSPDQRVHVAARTTGEIEALVFTHNISMESKGTADFEPQSQ